MGQCVNEEGGDNEEVREMRWEKENGKRETVYCFFTNTHEKSEKEVESRA